MHVGIATKGQRHVLVLVIDGLYIAGAQRHCLELLGLFGRSGFSRVVVALYGGGRWAERFLQQCEHLIVSDGTPVQWSDIQQVIGVTAAPIISAHLMSSTEWVTANAPCNVRSFAHLHCEPSEHEPTTAGWMHSVLPRFERVFVPARSTHRALTSLLPKGDALAAKFVVLPNSIPRNSRCSSDTPIHNGKLRIATITRVDEDKFSVPLFVDVLECLNVRGIDFELEIAGDGELLSRLKHTIAERPWARHIRFRGFVDDVTPIYTWSNVVFLPSKRESAPYVLLEALALRRPIVGPQTGVLAELSESDFVYVFPLGSAQDAADMIITAAKYRERPTASLPATAAIPEFADWERAVREAYLL